MPATFAQFGPINNPLAWTRCAANGNYSPGLLHKVTGFKRKHRVDKKKAKGAQGDTITLAGRPSAEGSFTFQLWTDQQIEEDWPNWVSVFDYDPLKTTPTAVLLAYPSLLINGISRVICDGIGPIIHVGHNLYEVELDLIEYNPPPPASAVVTPRSGTSSGQFGPPAPTAIDLANQRRADALAAAAASGHPF